MKWISVWGPWAQLLVGGIKDVENRGWSTDYRGPLAIYATKGGHTNEQAAEILADLVERGLITAEQQSKIAARIDDDRGKIIGIVDVVDCAPAEGHASPWAMQGFAIAVANAREVDPVEMSRGPQGRMIDLDDAVAARLLGQASERPSKGSYALTWEDLVGSPRPRRESNDEAKTKAAAALRSTSPLGLRRSVTTSIDRSIAADMLRDCIVEPYQNRPHGDLPMDETWAVRVTDPRTSTLLYDSIELGVAGTFDDEQTGRRDAQEHGDAWVTAQYSALAKATRIRAERKDLVCDRMDQVDAAEAVMDAHRKKVAALIKECADDRLTLRREAQDPEVSIMFEGGRFVVEAAPSLTDGTIGRRWWGAPGERPQP